MRLLFLCFLGYLQRDDDCFNGKYDRTREVARAYFILKTYDDLINVLKICRVSKIRCEPFWDTHAILSEIITHSNIADFLVRHIDGLLWGIE